MTTLCPAIVDKLSAAMRPGADDAAVAMDLRAVLMQLRMRRQMSQQDVAAEAGISPRTYFRAEKKGFALRPDSLQAIVQAMNRKLSLEEREVVKLAQAAHLDPSLVARWCHASSASPPARPGAASDELDRLFYRLRSLAPDSSIRALLEAQIHAMESMRVTREDIDSAAGPAQILRGFDREGHPIPPPGGTEQTPRRKTE